MAYDFFHSTIGVKQLRIKDLYSGLEEIRGAIMTIDQQRQLVEEVTGFSRGIFPLMYLGCPIGHAKKQKAHCSADKTKFKAS
ncbi:hypothetical protein H5410_040504 [Solanum commersonii]|uniref:Uncharacterized protein n=1 Tax=Solanum commersonii TaxID=4109 RepID=A0A9J5XSP8_SOLCO|nr:hypothetical protein H5410_040504 [Solanum commersonii]